MVDAPGAAVAPRPVRVVHLLNELLPSGAEAMLVSAAPHWAPLGISCDVVATAARAGPYASELAAAGYGVHHVPVGRAPGDFVRLRRFLRESGYDVVHQHPEGRGYWLALAARSAGLGVVRTVHNNFPFSGALRLRRRVQRAQLRWLGVRFVAIAPGVQDNERRRFGNPCELIWNWLDLPRFARIDPEERREARARLAIAPGTTVIASIGNCSAVKNHAAILHALAALAPRHALLYLHAGVEDPAASERQLARTLAVDPIVRFLGWQRDVRPVLAAADIFLMPSRFEGLGNAAIEALALGLPVVLADVDGLRDLRNPFPSIRYCPPTPEGLASALDAALESALVSAPAEVSGEVSAEAPADAPEAAPAGAGMLSATQIDEQVRTCHSLFDPRRGAAQYARLYRSLA